MLCGFAVDVTQLALNTDNIIAMIEPVTADRMKQPHCGTHDVNFSAHQIRGKCRE